MSPHCTMTKLNKAIAVELFPLGMRQAPIEFRNLYFKASRIGISQLNNAGQTAIKRLLEILTDVPRPPEDAQLSASDIPRIDHQTLTTTIRHSFFNQGLGLETKTAPAWTAGAGGEWVLTTNVCPGLSTQEGCLNMGGKPAFQER